MTKLKPLSALLLAGITSVSYATSPPAELQPRDLDGNPGTVEAYYYSPLNITWLVETNIGKTNTFGLQRSSLTINGQEDGGEVNNQGGMYQDSLLPYLQGMNQSQYLGYSNWRLPVAQGTDDLDCDQQTQIGNTLSTSGSGCTAAEVGQFNHFLVRNYGSIENSPFTNLDSNRRWLGSFGRSERHYYSFGGQGLLRFCNASGCNVGYVWPVHDGDIGTAASAQACADTDPVGDGWGWNGVSSCRVIGGEPPANTTCVDTDPTGDGWGWDGVQSCTVSPVTQERECEDTQPLGDGWGWDGITSCRIAADMQQRACVDSPSVGDGWGWNGVTSCRVQTNSDGLTDVERFRSYQYCPDTSPVGDGWGWTGSESCKVEPNLINNGDFSQGATDWITYVHPSAEETSFDLTRDLRLSYRDAGSEWWHSQAYTTPILLQSGRTYRLEFNHESGGKTGSAIGSVVVENGANFTTYLPRTDFDIGISAVRFQADFYVPVTDANARVTFNLGDNAGGLNSLNTGSIWLDNIVLKEIN